MKKNKEQSSFVNIGSSSLLIVFVILCLATFAILSLSSAKSDYSLSERLANHKGEYYEASSKAEAILDKIDSTLAEIAAANQESRLSGSSKDFPASPYSAAVIKALDGKQIDDIPISCKKADKRLTISYQVLLEKEQLLDVELIVTDFTTNETYYEIQKWQIISTDTWENDDTLNLMPVIQ